MRDNTKLILVLKTLLAVVCIGLLVWNALQEQAVANGKIKQEYEAYDPKCPLGEYRQVTVNALYPIGGEFIGTSYNLSSATAVYCAFEMENGSYGVVKINATAVGKSKKTDLSYRDIVNDTYKDWIVEDGSAPTDAQKDGLVIRGKTAEMPIWTVDMREAMPAGSFDFEAYMDQNDAANDTLDDIVLLDATVEVPVKGTLPSLVVLAAKVLLFFDAVTLLLDIYRLVRKKRSEQIGKDEVNANNV